MHREKSHWWKGKQERRLSIETTTDTAGKEDKCFSIRNDQSIGLLRKDNHVRRMRITGREREREEEEESITLNISSRAISDCCWRSNLPDREREKTEGIVP